MSRSGLAKFAAALVLGAVFAAATDANAAHRNRHHAHTSLAGTYSVTVAARRVAAFRRANVDRFIGPVGSWDKRHYYYRPYHYWRGPLVYTQTLGDRSHSRGLDRTFACKDTAHGVVCRERL